MHIFISAVHNGFCILYRWCEQNNIIFPLIDNNDGYNNHATMTGLVCSKYFSGIKIPVSSINIA